MKIAIAQMNPCVGDLAGNCQKILDFSQRAAALSAGLIIFPELSLLGYPPKDLLLRNDFLTAQTRYLERIAQETTIPVIVGAAAVRDAHHLPLNVAVLCHEARTRVVGTKLLLPNYNVFDEKRYFSTPNTDACHVFELGGTRILISICEDAWNSLPVDKTVRYDFDPIKNAINTTGRIDLLVNISASPFTQTKPPIRERIFTNLAKTYKVPVVMVGQVGANDQWLFDGHSMVINSEGTVIDRAVLCDEDLLIFDTTKQDLASKKPGLCGMALVHDVLVMGIRDYLEKCGLKSVVIGLSGGIDSAVVAALAVRALGPRRVKVVYLPTRFSSPQSYEDAYVLAENLGIKLECLLIEEQVQGLRELLANESAASKNTDIVDQNLQARMRGLIVMALANAHDAIMLATSNKSELAVGYSTIYGDMCGAFSPIGDLYKTEVYELAEAINRVDAVIPESIIVRPPSAELRDNQLDSDTLPNYEELDRILLQFIDYDKSPEDIEAITGLDKALIARVVSMNNWSEYKRRQGPFCLMVSDRVFGDARRLPIAKRPY